MENENIQMFTQSFKLAKKIINNVVVEIGIIRKVHFKRSFFAVIIEIRIFREYEANAKQVIKS